MHLPVPRVAHTNKAQLERYYQEEGESMLAAAKKKLDGAGIPYQARVLVGPVAETVVKHAKEQRCDLIYIGTRGMSELGKALLGLTATKVLHISDIPVLLAGSSAAGKRERPDSRRPLPTEKTLRPQARRGARSYQQIGYVLPAAL